MIKNMVLTSLVSLFFSTQLFANDLITGTWQQIDDKTGSPKVILKIRQDGQSNYTGQIIKVTPRSGYTPKINCVKCPAPYTNQPILGLNILRNLQHVGNNEYDKGTIIDPLNGKVYNAYMRLNNKGNRLTLRAYVGSTSLSRNQTWLRLE